MANQIAILEGYKMPRKAKKRSGGGRARFKKAAKSCKISARKTGRKGAYRACMKKKLKK